MKLADRGLLSGPGAKLPGMTDARATPAASTREPDVDENGVDLAQIRAMLDLTPAERLAHVATFTSALLEIRALNETRRSG